MDGGLGMYILETQARESAHSRNKSIYPEDHIPIVGFTVLCCARPSFDAFLFPKTAYMLLLKSGSHFKSHKFLAG